MTDLGRINENLFYANGGVFYEDEDYLLREIFVPDGIYNSVADYNFSSVGVGNCRMYV